MLGEKAYIALVVLLGAVRALWGSWWVAGIAVGVTAVVWWGLDVLAAHWRADSRLLFGSPIPVGTSRRVAVTGTPPRLALTSAPAREVA